MFDRKSYQKAWYVKNKSRIKSIRTNRLYGVDNNRYDLMLDAQVGVCKICGNKDRFGLALSIDHCHESMSVRGLLCSDCNMLLGFFEKGAMADKSAFAKYLMDNG